ncbi:MAG: hypothetical protein PW791_09210 [Neorhizobium sp.]|nr:hypothetical protein [Neorhizobium sp.]
MATYEIPLSGAPETFSIQLAGITYVLTFTYRDSVMGGWILSIADEDENPMVNGIPVITGADLLEPYGYLDFGGSLYAQTDADVDAVPTFTNFGSSSHLYFVEA